MSCFRSEAKALRKFLVLVAGRHDRNTEWFRSGLSRFRDCTRTPVNVPRSLRKQMGRVIPGCEFTEFNQRMKRVYPWWSL